MPKRLGAGALIDVSSPKLNKAVKTRWNASAPIQPSYLRTTSKGIDFSSFPKACRIRVPLWTSWTRQTSTHLWQNETDKSSVVIFPSYEGQDQETGSAVPTSVKDRPAGKRTKRADCCRPADRYSHPPQELLKIKRQLLSACQEFTCQYVIIFWIHSFLRQLRAYCGVGAARNSHWQ